MMKLFLLSLIFLIIWGYETQKQNEIEARKMQLDSLSFASYKQGFKDGVYAYLLTQTGECETVGERWIEDSINFKSK